MNLRVEKKKMWKKEKIKIMKDMFEFIITNVYFKVY